MKAYDEAQTIKYITWTYSNWSEAEGGTPRTPQRTQLEKHRKRCQRGRGVSKFLKDMNPNCYVARLWWIHTPTCVKKSQSKHTHVHKHVHVKLVTSERWVHCIDVRGLVVTLCYSFARWHNWGKLGAGYTGFLCCFSQLHGTLQLS